MDPCGTAILQIPKLWLYQKLYAMPQISFLKYLTIFENCLAVKLDGNYPGSRVPIYIYRISTDFEELLCIIGDFVIVYNWGILLLYIIEGFCSIWCVHYVI